MREGKGNTLRFLAGIPVLAGIFLLSTPPSKTNAVAADDAATREKIANFVRERFGLLDSIKLTVDPLKEFAHPAFLETTVTSDHGKEQKSNHALLTKDRRFLILGDTFALGDNPLVEIAEHVRTHFKLPAAMKVNAGPIHDSPYPFLLASTVTVSGKEGNQSQDFYVTRDRKWLIMGIVFDLSVDRRREVLSILKTGNQPSIGPADAAVTIVEFSDLQCASCGHMHELLEKHVLPKYSGKVRVVFKEFPLPSIHDWSLIGSLATQCAYRLNPGTYVRYRSLIFKNQASLNAANARDMLIAYGEQVGIDRLQLAACIDAKSSLARVEANFREGQAAGVQSTPTSFINGKMIVGAPAAETLFQYIEEALRAGR